MPKRDFGPMIERNVAEMRVSIEAAEFGLAEIHQNLACTLSIAGVLPVVGFYDGVGKRILCIRSRRYLLDLKFRTRPPRYDWFGPCFDRLHWARRIDRYHSVDCWFAADSVRGGRNGSFCCLQQVCLRWSFAKTLADCEINNIAAAVLPAFCYNSWPCFNSSARASQRWFASFAC